jgi:DNA-binding response OmpR family regulator
MAERVLIVDDDTRLSAMLSEYLAAAGFQVESRPTGRDGLAALERAGWDAVVLDLMLPDIEGFEVCRRIRAHSDIPILMLTARGEETDRVVGLELGADDYLAKPFSPRELLARVRAVLRRYQVQATLPERDGTRRAFRFSGWELNLRTRRLTSPAGEAVELSNGEFSLLNALCRAPRRVLSRDQLLSMSRLHEAEVYDRTIDVQIRRLRLKIETDATRPALIVTERGAGYLLASDVDTLY